MRTYKRKAGSRSYATNYSAGSIYTAILKITAGMSILKASKKYNIPYGTLYNRVHHLHTQNVGTPLRLTDETEQLIVNAVNTLAQWKVPLDGLDIRCLVKSYLDKQGVQDRRFTNNIPGNDWLYSFMTRHNLTARLADNVKPARAEISAQAVDEYFSELEHTLQGIDPGSLYNYDETNVSDDPGAKRIICRRGLKRVERKMEHTKSCISLMFSGNASGDYLPPMVVYKSQNTYQEWMRGGPSGTVYDCTPSGWFDSRCFERWFTEVFLTSVSTKPGTKVLLGDNLAAHFTPDVIKASVENNIAFVTLIPNATHLLQPLDVAVFRAANIKWRQILEGWRKESRYKRVLPKNHFPGLLLKLQNCLNPDNLVAGFKATGLYPFDPQQVLKRLPDGNRDGATGSQSTADFNDSIMELLQKHCAPSTATGKRPRGKKITPGKRITPTDVANTDAGATSSRTTKKHKKTAASVPAQSEDNRDTSDVEPETDETETSSTDHGKVSIDSSSCKQPADYRSTQWVVVQYAGKRQYHIFSARFWKYLTKV
jgi:hypothetical protein